MFFVLAQAGFVADFFEDPRDFFFHSLRFGHAGPFFEAKSDPRQQTDADGWRRKPGPVRSLPPNAQAGFSDRPRTSRKSLAAMMETPPAFFSESKCPLSPVTSQSARAATAHSTNISSSGSVV